MTDEWTCVWCGAIAVHDALGEILWTAAIDDRVVSFSMTCEHETLDGTRTRLGAVDILADLSDYVAAFVARQYAVDVVKIRIPAMVAAVLVDESVGGIVGVCATLREIHDVVVAIEVI